MTFPLGGGFFGAHLNPGWAVEGGGRVLLFNTAVTKAWTVSLSVSNFLNYEADPKPVATLFNFPVKVALDSTGHIAVPGSLTGVTPAVVATPQVSASVGMFNQTFVNLGIGREWYILGTADLGQQTGVWIWRVGADAGGRYGSAIVRFEDKIAHHTDVVGGMYGEIHTDAERPWRCGMIQIGVRSPLHREIFDWTIGKGVTIVTAEDVHETGPQAVVQRVRQVVGTASTYLSFDVDALDPAFAPGTGTPEVGGLATWQVRAILRRLPGLNFCGMDVVEVSPPYDVAEITALAAATVVWDYIALLAPQAG